MNVEREEEMMREAREMERKEKAEAKEEGNEKDELRTIREINGHRRDRRMPLGRDGQPGTAMPVILGSNPTPHTTDFRNHRRIRRAISGEAGL